MLLARRLVNGRERGCLQVVYLALSVVKEQSLSASLVRLEKELFPLYLGHPLSGLLPSVVGGYHEKWPIRASLRPLAIYIYVFGSQSCAIRLIFAGSAPLAAAKQAALGTLGSSARCSGSRPLSRSLRRRSRRLRGDTRRNASSVNTPPRLATCLTAHPTNRVATCRSVRHSPPRPLPHLP